ncbi:unnamed protein product, partial [marine sediment metagenome]
GKVLGNLVPGGVDRLTGEPSKHVLACDLGEDQTITDSVCPLKVQVDETSNWYPTGDPSQVNADLWAGWFVVQVGLEPTGSTTILRVESNTKGITLDSCIDFIAAGVPAGDFRYLFNIGPEAEKTAWSYVGAPTNINGWLKVRIAAADRWIALYETTP